jgi:hypothetical protein
VKIVAVTSLVFREPWRAERDKYAEVEVWNLVYCDPRLAYLQQSEVEGTNVLL